MRTFWPRADAGGPSPAISTGVAPGGALRDYGSAGAASADPRYSRLPPAAAAKLHRLKGEQDDIDAAAYQLSQGRQGFLEAKRTAEQNIRNQAEFRAGRGIALHRGEPAAAHERQRAIAAAEADLAAAVAELADIDARIQRLNSKKSVLCRNVFDWLKDRVPPGAGLLDEHPALPPAQLAKGQTWPAAVAALRDKISSLRADVGEVAAAPLPSGLVKQRARAQLEALAENGRPNVMAAIEVGRPIVFRSTNASVHVASVAGAALGTAAVEDAVALIGWLFKDRLVEMVEAEVDELSDDKHALDPQQRAEREHALAAQILETERLEEAMIEAASADGIELQRRGDADPRAVLGLTSALPAPRT